MALRYSAVPRPIIASVQAPPSFRDLTLGDFADKEFRDQQVRSTARVAAEVPLRCVEKCREALVLAEALVGRSNVNALSDLRVAALLLQAAGHGAAENVLVNIPLIGTDDWTQATEKRVAELMDEIVALATKVHDLVMSGERRPALDSVPEPVAGR